MSKYKIDPESVNFLKNRYPDAKIKYMIDNKESLHKNETKANAIEFDVDGSQYRVNHLMNSDGKREYEVIELGAIINKIIGKYGSVVGAVDGIHMRVAQ